MTHLEIENLASDYLEGLLEPSQKAAVEVHLNECATCTELLDDVRQVLEMSRSAEDVEPRPWLISKIVQATVGARKPTWSERVAAYLRSVLQPRVAYPIAMTVFTFSVIVNAAGLNLRSLRMEDMNPRTWVDRANRQGHLLEARAEKFYYDLRVVYEIESRFRQIGGQPQMQEQVPKPVAPEGGSSQSAPSDPTTASNGVDLVVVAATREQALPSAGNRTVYAGTGRSVIP